MRVASKQLFVSPEWSGKLRSTIMVLGWRCVCDVCDVHSNSRTFIIICYCYGDTNLCETSVAKTRTARRVSVRWYAETWSTDVSRCRLRSAGSNFKVPETSIRNRYTITYLPFTPTDFKNARVQPIRRTTYVNNTMSPNTFFHPPADTFPDGCHIVYFYTRTASAWIWTRTDDGNARVSSDY